MTMQFGMPGIYNLLCFNGQFKPHLAELGLILPCKQHRYRSDGFWSKVYIRNSDWLTVTNGVILVYLARQGVGHSSFQWSDLRYSGAKLQFLLLLTTLIFCMGKEFLFCVCEKHFSCRAPYDICIEYRAACAFTVWSSIAFFAKSYNDCPDFFD